MYWIKTEDRLPKPGKFVIGRHNRGTWHDSTDQENVNCVIVKLVMGRIIPEPCPPGTVITRADQWSNNQKPYYWDQFGCDYFFGQEIIEWSPLTEDRCKDCRWWDKNAEGEPKHMGYARCGQQFGDNRSDWLPSGVYREGTLWTGPDFSCVNFKEKGE